MLDLATLVLTIYLSMCRRTSDLSVPIPAPLTFSISYLSFFNWGITSATETASPSAALVVINIGLRTTITLSASSQFPGLI